MDEALRAVGAVGAVRAVGAVGAEGAEEVWAHIGSLEILLKHLHGRPSEDNGRGWGQ